MQDHEMTDEQILKDRESKYGPPKECFETWGHICKLMDEYADESPFENKAHLSALKMAALKLVRSIWNPHTKDNYKDGRNYFTIAEICSEVKND